MRGRASHQEGAHILRSASEAGNVTDQGGLGCECLQLLRALRDATRVAQLAIFSSADGGLGNGVGLYWVCDVAGREVGRGPLSSLSSRRGDADGRF